MSASSTLAGRVLAGDPRAIARAISLIENEDPASAALVGDIFSRTGRAYLIGVTGPPGAGKSTLVDRLTTEIRKTSRTVGIIAVDPTSPFSGGATTSTGTALTLRGGNLNTTNSLNGVISNGAAAAVGDE